MLPAPPVIRECPHCQMALLFPRFEAGSLREATVWTDGRMVGPWIPEELALVGCPFCAESFWTRQSQALGVASEAYSDARWPEARVVTELDAAAILQAIATGRADTPRKERYLRMHAWWRDGDRRREGVAKELDRTEPDGEMRENMRRLHLLLDEEQPDDRLMKAELARQLGRFDEALHLMAYEFAKEEHQAAGARIAALAREGRCEVAKVDFPLGPEALPRD
jgi:hypothetical protein